MSALTITIDGPAGVGKSTLAKSLAKHLGTPYLNSGSLYRAVAWKVSKQGVNTDDEDAVLALCKTTNFLLSLQGDYQSVVVDGTRLTHELWTSHISLIASEISRLPTVRTFLRPIQRHCGNDKGIVAEGRDMGTHVFADAEIKVFLDASPTIRAQRRFLELQGHDAAVSHETAASELMERDTRDANRNSAPLRPASDATIIDTTDLSAIQVVDAILALIKQRQIKHRSDPTPTIDTTKQSLASY
tara:strand:- start:550 stop:1281 length:732 start_codon:yes stop_codon:yes gene_type:complete